MSRVLACALALVLACLSVTSATAGKMARLGTDPAGDGPPALDVTFLDVGRTKSALEIRIGVDKMFPVVGGYPEGPGIEWIFTVGKRTFIAEAVAGRTPKFFFFELKGDSFEQLSGMTGTYDSNEGFIRMLIPLDLIGAKKGSIVAGLHDPLESIDKAEGSDVDAHLHGATGTEYLDQMTTTEKYIVP